MGPFPINFRAVPNDFSKKKTFAQRMRTGNICLPRDERETPVLHKLKNVRPENNIKIRQNNINQHQNIIKEYQIMSNCHANNIK